MSPQFKRWLFPLQGPRMITNAFWSIGVLSAAVEGYWEGFFGCYPDLKKV